MDRQERATTEMAAFKHALPARPRPGLSAEFQVHRERKGNSGLFSYPEKKSGLSPPRWGEGVGSPASQPGSHKGYSSLTEQAQKETPAPSQTPPSHLRAGQERWRGEPEPMDATGLRNLRAFPAAPVPWSQLALGADTDTTDRHAHTAHGPSLCTNTLGPAAARASHFLLHVVVELEFGLVGQLHGPVLQLPRKGERC